MDRNLEKQILKELKEIKDAMKGTCKPFMNLENCANYIGISKNSLYSKTSKNEIPFYRVGKRIFFCKIEVDKWILDHQKKIRSNAEVDQQIATEIMINEL